MKNYLIIIFSVISILLFLYWGFWHGFSISWLNPFTDRIDYTSDNNRLLRKIDSLENISRELQVKIDSVGVVRDSLKSVVIGLESRISEERNKSLKLEWKLLKSIDSLNKYKADYRNYIKKYNLLKMSQTVPNNQQTLDFFKNY